MRSTPVSVAILTLWAASARGLINPRFTPADLAKSSSQIVVLDARAPQRGAILAEVRETLRGPGLGAKQLTFAAGDDDTLGDTLAEAFGGRPSAPAILFVGTAGAGADAPAGALLVGTKWVAVQLGDRVWTIEPDKRDLSAVWGGSARSLAAAMKQLAAHPQLDFPVKSSAVWGQGTRGGRHLPILGLPPQSRAGFSISRALVWRFWAFCHRVARRSRVRDPRIADPRPCGSDSSMLPSVSRFPKGRVGS
jgi:hypothetical protein